MHAQQPTTTRPAPWLSLGARLDGHEVTPAEVARAAGFYRVREVPLRLDEGEGALVPDRKALVREDGRYVANVGAAYRPIDFEQVVEVLMDAVAPVGAQVVAAGLYGPREARAWCLFEIPGELHVRGDPSPIRRYFIGHAGHDGLAGVVLANIATRVACTNCLGAALSESGAARWHVPHVGDTRARLADVRAGLKHLVDGFGRLHALAEHLARTRFSDVQLHRALDRVLPLPDDRDEHPRLVAARERVVQLFHEGTGIEGPMRGTAYAAWNGLTEYCDWEKPTRAIRGRRVEALRLESSWLGRGAALKRAGLQAILDEAGLALAA